MKDGGARGLLAAGGGVLAGSPRLSLRPQQCYPHLQKTSALRMASEEVVKANNSR